MRLATPVMAAAIGVGTTLAVIDSITQAPAESGRLGDDDISSIRAEPGQGRSSQWTAERMGEAQPALLPVADPEEVRVAFRHRRIGLAVPGVTAAGEPAQEIGRQSGNVHAYPLTMAGRLYYNEPDDKAGRGHICTAQFVAPSVVLTAAHCVQDHETHIYHRNFMFALEYERGVSEHQYFWRCAATKKAWAQPGEGRYLFDYAMIQVESASEVGWFGLEWNWIGKYRGATKIGYPSGSFNGEIIQVDAGPLSVTDGIVELKHGNKDVQHGSSGGGWVGDYTTNPRVNANHLISSESFSRGEAGETSGISYGPYYTEALLSLLNYTKAGCR